MDVGGDDNLARVVRGAPIRNPYRESGAGFVIEAFYMLDGTDALAMTAPEAGDGPEDSTRLERRIVAAGTSLEERWRRLVVAKKDCRQ